MPSKVSLTQNNLKDILDAFEHFFPAGTVYSADRPFTSISGEYSWPNRSAFVDFIFRLTDIKITSDKDFSSMKQAQQKLVNLVAGVSETEELVSTLPDEQTRAIQGEEAKRRQEEIAKTQKKAREEVQEEKDRLQKIRQEKADRENLSKQNRREGAETNVSERSTVKIEEEAQTKEKVEYINSKYKAKIEELKKIQPELENKIIYARVEASTVEDPDPNTKKFIDEAKSHPLKFRNEISNNIRESFTNSNFAKNLSTDEISIIADKTANDIVFAVNNPSLQAESNYQVAILDSLSKSDNVVDKISGSPAVKEFLKTAPSEMAFFKDSTQLGRNVLSSFNQKLATAVFGPDPQNIRVTFYKTLVEGCTHNINLGEVNKGYTNLVQTQSDFEQQIGSLGQGQAKQFIFGRARFLLDEQIAKLPAQNLLKSAYHSALGQKTLNLIGLSKTSLFNQTLIENVIYKIPSVSIFTQRLASKIGVDLGFSTISTTSALIEAPATISTGISTNSTIAIRGAGTSLKSIAGKALVKIAPRLAAKLGVGAAAGAAAGTVTGAGSGFLAGLVTGPWAVITAIIGAFIGLIKALWPKIKEFFNTYGVGVGAVLLGGGVITGSPILIATGAPILIFTVPVVGGLKAAAIKLGVLFKIVLATLVVNIGTPIVVTILTIPVVVAFMLLVINSGAYVTPPGNIGSINYGPIDVVCDINNSGISGTSPVANAAICIVMYLDQFNLNPLSGGLVGSPSWLKLEQVLPKAATDPLADSAVSLGWLQCVGFASATSGYAFGTPFNQINACSYLKNAPSGYSYYPGTSGIQSGDFFLMDGSSGCSGSSPGHIGVVVSVDGALISCADANAVAPGKARASHGCYALSQIDGYFRKQ